MGFKGREKKLFEAAAQAFTEMSDPFQGEWLAENDVTADECRWLSSMIGAAMFGLSSGDERLFKDTMLVGVSRQSGVPEHLAQMALIGLRGNDALKELQQLQRKRG
jgi:hypothetical protein